MTKAGRARGSPPTDPRLAQLDAWVAGAPLGQKFAQDLRVAVYEAIEAAIDWDGEKLERSTFASATQNRPFRQRSIIFQRQETQPTPTQVRLTIPALNSDEASFSRTALALRGLILAGDRNGEWAFPDGTAMLAALQGSLAQWTVEVVRQIKALPGSTENWNAISAAAELLGVGACLAGRIKPDADHVELLTGALSEWPEEGGAQCPDLQNLYKRLRRERERLAGLVRSVSSGTKGGRVGAFLDPDAVLPPLVLLRRRAWRLDQSPPGEGLAGDWAALAKTYQEVSRVLQAAAAAERQARLEWLAGMEEAFGSEARRSDIVRSISAARDAAVSAGIAGQKASTLKDCIEQFATVQFDDAIKAAGALREEVDALSLLPHYGRGRITAVNTSRELADVAQTFLKNVEAELANLEEQFGSSGTSLPADLETIAAALGEVQDELKKAPLS